MLFGGFLSFFLRFRGLMIRGKLFSELFDPELSSLAILNESIFAMLFPVFVVSLVVAQSDDFAFVCCFLPSSIGLWGRDGGHLTELFIVQFDVTVATLL